MKYSDLLQKRDWIEKSASIIQRDSFKCKNCGSVGFHSMSLYICKDSVELDNIFKGWEFNNLTFSSFIDREIKAVGNFEFNNDADFKKTRRFSINPYNEFNNEKIQFNGYSLYRLSCSVFDLDFINRNAYCYFKEMPQKHPIYQRHFVDKSTDNSIAKGLIVKINGKKLSFELGNVYLFNDVFEENYVFSLEYIFPTGPNGVFTDDLYTKLYGSIVLNISYKNFVGSFYFFPNQIKGLNVHHKYYIKDKAPWEYEDDALITLCEDCHQKAHHSHIPIYREIDSNRILYTNTSTCDRCNGTGYLPQYRHVENGICFKCWGEGVVLDSLE